MRKRNRGLAEKGARPFGLLLKMAPYCVANLELDPSGPAVRALPGAILSSNAVAYRPQTGSL